MLKWLKELFLGPEPKPEPVAKCPVMSAPLPPRQSVPLQEETPAVPVPAPAPTPAPAPAPAKKKAPAKKPPHKPAPKKPGRPKKNG